MDNPYFVQVGLANFPEYVYAFAPDAPKKFAPIPLLEDVEYHCLLIEAQAQSFALSMSSVFNDPYLVEYKDRFEFGCFAVTPRDGLCEIEVASIEDVDHQAIVTGSDNDEAHSASFKYKVAGVSLNRVFYEILDKGDFIDCLALDVQGLESKILYSLSYHPRVVVVEIHSPKNESEITEWAKHGGYVSHGEIYGTPERPNLLFVRR